MIGAIIGDIVGSRFEFNNYRSTRFELFHKDCSFTDDTVCTIAVADWLNGKCVGDLSGIMRHWCLRYPAPAGGYGGSFRQWVFSDSGAYNSYGNGSAMRVSPVGWLGEHQDVIKFARMSAAITHNHPEGIKGAECIGDLIWRVRNGQNKAEIKKHVEQVYGYGLDFKCSELSVTNRFDETCQVTVPQAIVCFLESTDFESALRLAISIGGDSDTIAAIAGSLAEAAYGVPEDIKTSAFDFLPEEIKQVINQFYCLHQPGVAVKP